ncbi:hypothetical protein ACFU76_29480 [Streptomyces sp. NPDC057539]
MHMTEVAGIPARPERTAATVAAGETSASVPARPEHHRREPAAPAAP